MLSPGSTVVEHSTQNPKIKGSNLVNGVRQNSKRERKNCYQILDATFL